MYEKSSVIPVSANGQEASTQIATASAHNIASTRQRRAIKVPLNN
jgi:hypothetical protein